MSHLSKMTFQQHTTNHHHRNHRIIILACLVLFVLYQTQQKQPRVDNRIQSTTDSNSRNSNSSNSTTTNTTTTVTILPPTIGSFTPFSCCPDNIPYTNTNTTTILSWECHHPHEYCGGLADRINGILQLYYLSLCFSTSFQIHEWNDLSNYLVVQNNINNNINNNTNIIKINTMDNRNHPIWNDIQTHNPSSILYNNNNHNNHTIIQWHNNLWMPSLVPSSCENDTVLYPTLFHQLFTWNTTFLQRVQQIKQQIFHNKHTNNNNNNNYYYYYIAVHIRTGMSTDWKDEPTLFHNTPKKDFPLFLQCIQQMQQMVQTQCNTTYSSRLPIFLATDSIQVKEYFMMPRRNQNTNANNNDTETKNPYDSYYTRHGPITHVDRSTTTSTHENAWLDWKLLSEATILIQSQSSKYSELAGRFATNRVRVNECTTTADTISIPHKVCQYLSTTTRK